MAIIIGGKSTYASSSEGRALTDLFASYDESCLVGTEYDIEKLSVLAYFEGEDDPEDLNYGDYNVSSRLVTREGENVYVVIYMSKSTTFTVVGKNVREISASYLGDSNLSVGNKIDENEIALMISYTDYSSVGPDKLEELEKLGVSMLGFEVAQAEITRLGENKVYVSYAGKQATFSVFGTPRKVVEDLNLIYDASSPVSIHGAIPSKNISLFAIYTDGSTERIYNYTLEPATIEELGVNTVVISFQDKSRSFEVIGMAKSIESIFVSYVGANVPIGKKVRLKDVIVTATYNDGSKGIETEFDIIGGGMILTLGANVLTVNALGQRASIYVIGVEPSAADFDESPKYEITNGKHTTTIAFDIPSDYEKDALSVKSIETDQIKRLLSREVRKGEYIPFNITIPDLELDAEVPFLVQLSLPDEYEIGGCSVYFTPNQKSIIGRMNIDIVGDKYIQFMFYKEGTYLLTFNPDWNLVEEEEEPASDA